MKGRHLVLLAVAACLVGGVALAQPGSQISVVPLPVPGFGVSVAVGCDGTVYYQLQDGANSDNNLYKMDKNGVLLGMVPVVDLNGTPVFVDEMAFDRTRNGSTGILWAQEHNSNPVNVWQVDPASGLATFAFISATISVGSYRDGIAYDGTDDTIWISGDVSTTIEHYTSAGGLINMITPTDAGGNVLGLISGVIVGLGDLLYLGRNGAAEIVQVKKSDGSFISSFASPGGTRDEGLECDTINFAPLLALWSREFFAPGFMSVIELEPGTCVCGGFPIRLAGKLEAIPGDGQATAKWTTETEIDILGFNLYIKEGTGSFVKVNQNLILGQGSYTEGASYEYLIPNLRNNRPHVVKLKVVAFNGLEEPEDFTAWVIPGTTTTGGGDNKNRK
jgi:hypothetical protein